MEYNASMERFIHRKKLEHYLTLLTQTKDEAQRLEATGAERDDAAATAQRGR